MAKIRTFIGLFLILCLAIPCLGTLYTVGDSSGWTLGVDYGSWSSSKTFLVGDTLVFNYGSGHTVDEVKQNDYTTCIIGNPINSYNKGSTKILLQTSGTHYFICGVIGHCSSGMKLSVNVLTSGTPVSSPNSTSTSSSTTGRSPTIYPTTTATTPMMIPESVAASPGKLSPPVHGVLIVIGGMAFVKYAFLS